MCLLLFNETKYEFNETNINKLKKTISNKLDITCSQINLYLKTENGLSCDALDETSTLKNTDTVLMLLSQNNINNEIIQLAEKSSLFQDVPINNIYYDVLKVIKPYVGNGKIMNLSHDEKTILLNLLFLVEDHRPKTKDHHSYSLSLANNDIYSIPKSINNYNHITYLKLSNNNINLLPNEITELVNLVDIDLSYNDIGYLPENFHNLRNISKLNLSNNNIFEFPIELTKIQSLQHLYFKNNKLGELPDEIKNLINLEYLDLCNNSIYNLNSHIKYLNKLDYLDLSNNALNEIPEQFTNLYFLRTLKLSYNKLSKLPDFIKDIPNLTHIDLSNNSIDSLGYNLKGDTSILQLKQRIDINLDGNPIYELNNPLYTDEDFCIINLDKNNVPIKPHNKFI